MAAGMGKFGRVGIIWVANGPKGVVRTAFGGSRKKFLATLDKKIEWIEDPKIKPALKFDISSGTPFEQRVWRAIAKIPWGKTRSYSWLAKTAGKPGAVRAAANACGKNPVPLFIPCHRVIAKDGSLGGFSAGIKWKKLLLKAEGFEST